MCKVLIIEDDLAVRETIKDTLELKDYLILTAENGLDALEVCKDELPDLIISDVMMPYMNGYEVLRAFQGNPRTSSIPFIFLSAKANSSDIRKGMNGGADDYITKPFKVKELLDAVEMRLKKKKRFDDTVKEITTNISQFVPHELRTPLVGIMGYTEILINEHEKITGKELLEILYGIKSAGNKLYKIIEKFIIHSELVAATDNNSSEAPISGRTSFSADWLNLNFDNLFKDYGRLEDIKIEIAKADVGIPDYYMKKVIEEIIENSLKFSTPGTIVEIKGKSWDNVYILEIIDHGIGMTKEQVAKITPFLQHQRNTLGQDGNGLGLSIVQKIVSMYNGKFLIDSKKEGFTHITLTLHTISSKVLAGS